MQPLRALGSTSRFLLQPIHRTLASHAYIPPSPSPTASHSKPQIGSGPSSSSTAAITTPSLSPDQHEVISQIIRVDQAGELGANWIYRGQKWAMGVRGDRETEKEIEEMWATERHHLATASLLGTQHRVRPTLLYPLWQGLSFALGAGTGLMGRETAMACTEAVETVIGEHYDDQLKSLQPLLRETDHPSIPLLRDVLTEFRDDELEHLDAAVAGGAQKAPGHSLMSAFIGVGCKAAIKVCERI